MVKESLNPVYGEEFEFKLLDGKIPVDDQGRREKIRVGVWDWEKNLRDLVNGAPSHQFIGGVRIGLCKFISISVSIIFIHTWNLKKKI